MSSDAVKWNRVELGRPGYGSPEPDPLGKVPADAMRFFNTEGPIKVEHHYSVPPLSRIDLAEVLTLIGRLKYFVLHAPRQSGKTTLLGALLASLNRTGRYRCVYVNVEVAQAAREDAGEAMRAILEVLAKESAWTIGERCVEEIWPAILDRAGPHAALNRVLSDWAAADPKPLVLFVDEIDSLVGDTLISVLRQIRSGYRDRPHRFPQSIVLCGVRDVRDCRIFSSREGTHVTGGSAFNIKAESLRLGDFTEGETRALIGQHTEETGQIFEEGALARVWELTRGQPWLVNALAYQACFRDRAGRARDRPISARAIDDAKETLVQDRVTHLDQLADKLREQRVQRVIEPILAGSEIPVDLLPDDLDYVRDLGLVRVDGVWEVANPIYREVIPRQLTHSAERSIAHEKAWYVRRDGSLDVARLLEAFQAYFRQNSEHWQERFLYKEAGPQLLLQAFLQGALRGRGRIEREYALGSAGTDLLIIWSDLRKRDASATRKHAVECNVLREGRGLEQTIRSGLEQTLRYMDRCGAESGHLVLFDRRVGKSWGERVFRKEELVRGVTVTVWGM